MDGRPISYYARVLREKLGPETFAPARSRLVWLAAYVAVAAAGINGIALGWGGVAGRIALSLVVGLAFGGLAFCAHEILHGAVVRSGTWRHVLGWVAFLPFTVSPRHWVAWHNREHHQRTMQAGVDPDAYPTLSQYLVSRKIRAADRFAVGRWRVLGFMSLVIGFTGQAAQTLLRVSRRVLAPRQWRWALGETLLGVGLWAALAIHIGAGAFVFAYVVPLAIGNAIVMAHILTNHSLSPLTDVNDPLLNSLSVTTPRLVSAYTLSFGLHVEHHLFPSMSSRHAHRVREEVLRLWPERYQSMPLLRAVARLFRTARIYKTPTTLLDVPSGREFPALLPRPSGDIGHRPSEDTSSICS